MNNFGKSNLKESLMMRKQRRQITRISKVTQESAKVTEQQVKAVPLSGVCYLKPKATTVFAWTLF